MQYSGISFGVVGPLLLSMVAMTTGVTFGEEREYLVSTIYTQPALVSVTRRLSQVLVEQTRVCEKPQ